MKIRITKKDVLRTIWEYLVMTFAVLVFTVAWESFMIPNNMSAGGLMGLCAVIEFATAGAIKASVSYLVINSILIILATLAFGIGFGFKTIFCILASTVMLHIFDGWTWIHAVPGNFLYVDQKLLIPIISGVLEAVGVGLIIRHGGSTGGTDIVALIVNKYYPVNLSTVFLITDMVIITSILFIPGKAFADMMYGYIMMVTFSMTIDYIVVGNRSTMQVMVFSNKYDQIADFITKKMGRGVTVLKAQGWFTKSDKNVLLVLLQRKELSDLTQVIKEVDHRAFMSVNKVGGVYGEGFEEIKAGVASARKKKQDNGTEQ